MTIGASILVAAVAVPFFLYSHLLAGSTGTILTGLSTGLALLVAGACVYSRGKGYGAWPGLLALSIVGLLILMLLPDRRLDKENRISRQKTRRLVYCVASPFALLALLWIADWFGAFFARGSVCKECGASQSSRLIFWIPVHEVTATNLSASLDSLGYQPNHKHEWLFSAGGGSGIQCAIGKGRELLGIVNSPDAVIFLEKARANLPEEEFNAAVRQILSQPRTWETNSLIGCGTTSGDFLAALNSWKSSMDAEEEHTAALGSESPADNSQWKPRSLDGPTEGWPEVPLR